MTMEQLFFRGCGLLVVSLGVGLGIHAAQQRSETPSQIVRGDEAQQPRADVINGIGRVVGTVTDNLRGESSRVSTPAGRSAAPAGPAERTTAAEDALEELRCEAYHEQWQLAAAQFEARAVDADAANTINAPGDDADDQPDDVREVAVVNTGGDVAVSDAEPDAPTQADHGRDTAEQPADVDEPGKADDASEPTPDPLKNDEPVTVADAKVDEKLEATDDVVAPAPAKRDEPVTLAVAAAEADAVDDADNADNTDAVDAADAPVVSDAVKDRFAPQPADTTVADADTDAEAGQPKRGNVEKIDPSEMFEKDAFINRPVPPVVPVIPVVADKAEPEPYVKAKPTHAQAGVTRTPRGAVRGPDGSVRPADEVVVIEANSADDRHAEYVVKHRSRPRYRNGRFVEGPYDGPAHDWNSDGWQPGRGFPSHCEGGW